MSRPCSRATAAILRARADQDRDDDAGLRRLDRAAQRGLVAGMRNDRRRRRAPAWRARSGGRISHEAAYPAVRCAARSSVGVPTRCRSRVDSSELLAKLPADGWRPITSLRSGTAIRRAAVDAEEPRDLAHRSAASPATSPRALSTCVDARRAPCAFLGVGRKHRGDARRAQPPGRSAA